MKIVVALTGASGQLLGIRLIELLSKKNLEIHLVISNAAKKIIESETNYTLDSIYELATKCYEETEIDAPIASGSFQHNGMVIIPCSIKTASSIAYGVTGNLVTRAADVVLKEGRKLILVVREAPLHFGHLLTLSKLARMGAIIFPPVISFYHKPKTLDDVIDHIVCRVAEKLGINVEYKRWNPD